MRPGGEGSADAICPVLVQLIGIDPTDVVRLEDGAEVPRHAGDSSRPLSTPSPAARSPAPGALIYREETRERTEPRGRFSPSLSHPFHSHLGHEVNDREEAPTDMLTLRVSCEPQEGHGLR